MKRKKPSEERSNLVNPKDDDPARAFKKKTTPAKRRSKKVRQKHTFEDTKIKKNPHDELVRIWNEDLCE